MATHIGILPIDVLETLSRGLNDRDHDASKVTPPLFLRLPHPRTNIPSLFLLSKGASSEMILEVQAVAPPNKRSWFIERDEVVADGKLLLMTPIDPAFLLIPILRASLPDDGTLGPFRPLDDMFEDAAANLTQSPSTEPLTLISQDDILSLASLDIVKAALRRVCETKDITEDLTVYRFSSAKLLECLRKKVARLTKAHVFDASRTLVRGLAKDGLMEEGKEDLLEIGRIKAACDLVGQYLPRTMHADLLASFDFSSLNAYLKTLQDEAAAALATTHLATGKKRGAKTDATKKSTDDKKRKSSQGVEKLKKVDTKNMTKLSSFFAKVPASAT